MREIACKTVRYGRVVALDGVSLRIGDGERVAVAGPNGAGKTTLLKALGDALERVSPKCLRGGARSCATVAVVPQTIPADLPMFARDFVMLGRTANLSPWRAPSRADEEAVGRALAAVEATALAGRRMDAVSGGERQRLALAMALATEAPCLLLDEPAAHLDFRRRDELFALLARLGKTVVMAIHELPFDTGFFTRVILMSAGRIVADGSPDGVLTEANISAAYGVPVSVVSRRAANAFPREAYPPLGGKI
ncbi:MAG: ABC transporter ATP-binding protein [Kiritimatiellae bacterium]|nr:ABC transporter ATP-binding protein [Kiritimatiellia bacterium]